MGAPAWVRNGTGWGKEAWFPKLPDVRSPLGIAWNRDEPGAGGKGNSGLAQCFISTFTPRPLY